MKQEILMNDESVIVLTFDDSVGLDRVYMYARNVHERLQKPVVILPKGMELTVSNKTELTAWRNAVDKFLKEQE